MELLERSDLKNNILIIEFKRFWKTEEYIGMRLVNV